MKKLLNNKKGAQNNGLIVIIVIGLIVAGLIYTGKINFNKAPVVVNPVEPNAPGCYVTKTSVTIGAQDAYVPATTPTGDYNMVWTTNSEGNLVKLGSYQQGDTITLSPGTKIQVLFVENSTTYYGKLKEYVIPCDGVMNIKESVYKIAADSDVSTTVWNDDGTVNEAAGSNTGKTNLTFTAGSTKNVEFKVVGDFQRALSNPDLTGGVISCGLNQTAYDEEVTTISGASKVANPGLITGVTGMVYESFSFPTLKSNAEQRATLSLKAGDTYYPTNAANGDVTCTIYDQDYDVNADTGAVISGVTDEDNNNLGSTETISFTLHTGA